MPKHGNQGHEDARPWTDLQTPRGGQKSRLQGGREGRQKGAQLRRKGSKVILSFGAGLNSTALLLRWLREERPLDLVIFSDTGDEMDESFEVAVHAAEVCRRHGVEFTVVQNERQLHERYRQDRALPLPHRNIRSCTANLKVVPIKYEIRRRGWDKCGVVMLIGIAYDEAHRMKDELPQYAEPWWPLVYDWKMTRKDCQDEIDAHWDGPPVIKSGCKGCPFIGERGFLELARTDRLAFQRWRKTEEMARDYPKNRLFADGSTLAQIEERADTEQTLGAWVRPSIECGVGACLPDARQTVAKADCYGDFDCKVPGGDPFECDGQNGMACLCKCHPQEIAERESKEETE